MPLITPLLDDASPLVRAMAVWAARRLLKEADVKALRQHHEPRERDGDVSAEWTRNLEGCAA
jgi:epoxyqueuosine reductase